MKKIIMGIDPGTRITGYGIISCKDRNHTPLDFGCIRPPATLELPQRYLILYESLEALFLKYQPEVVAVETQFVKKNVQSAIKLGMARGMVLLAAAKFGAKIYEYTPKKAKLAVSGNGSASKEQVQRMIQLLLKLPHPPEPEDAADALALAICYAHEKKEHLCTNRLKENSLRKNRPTPFSKPPTSPTGS